MYYIKKPVKKGIPNENRNKLDSHQAKEIDLKLLYDPFDYRQHDENPIIVEAEKSKSGRTYSVTTSYGISMLMDKDTFESEYELLD